MNPKKYFSYVRVSTQRQGQTGTSIAEQMSAIDSYALRHGLNIIRRFEERETAAKTGRPVFLDLLKGLKNNAAQGLIIHKIDRSARNLKDWAELGSLIDLGVEVHFANESLDLNSRGGRLSADIQAVVASDYIRNLREETKKGIYGRLKQGLYPFPARVGYLDCGKGKPKKIDPLQGQLVKEAFELYGTGNWPLNKLVELMYEKGLRNKGKQKISRNGLVGILKNPFYYGLIKINKTNELFTGLHKPLIAKRLFDQVQNVFAGRRKRGVSKHYYTFRKLISCSRCKYLLIAENQKGHQYYRCHTKNCPQKTVREEAIDLQLMKMFQTIQLSKTEYEWLRTEVDKLMENEPSRIEMTRRQLTLEIDTIGSRLAKLADAYVDEVFDKQTYLQKKNELIIKQYEIKEKLRSQDSDYKRVTEDLDKFLELVNSVYLSYKLGNPDEKREMVQIVTSNLQIMDKKLIIKLKKPFHTASIRDKFPVGRARRAFDRDFLTELKELFITEGFGRIYSKFTNSDIEHLVPR